MPTGVPKMLHFENELTNGTRIRCYTGVSEMLHSSESPKNADSVRFLLHTIRTKDKPKKYDGKTDIINNIGDGEKEKIINLFMT